MIPYFNESMVMAVTPAMKVHHAGNILQKIQSAEYNIGILLKSIMHKLEAIHVTPGPFSLFKKEIFEKIGYFKHAHNTEDMEIAFRLQEHRYRIANCPNAFVYTITPNTFKKLYKQRTRWTYGFLKNVQDYRHMLFNSKYGNMGMLTLPFAISFSAIALIVYL
jgi:biofilm PGA synthesis N-glycosyltransferase PgaC